MWFAGELFLFFSAAAVVHSAAAPFRHVLHERADPEANAKWRRGDRVHGDAIVPLRVGLTQSNLDQAEQYLMSISHPSSPRYGQHLTPEEVHDLFAPSADTVAEVKEWLIDSGIAANGIVHSDNKGWLATDVPASIVENIFRTSFHEYTHESSGIMRIGCSEYHVPHHLAHHIDYVVPGVKFSPPLKKRSLPIVKKRGEGHHPGGPGWGGPWHWIPPYQPWQQPPGVGQLSSDLQGCGLNITPACIRALYDIPRATLTDDVNQLGIYENGNYYDQLDLDLFYAKYAPYVPQGTGPTVNSIDGGKAPQSLCLATNLDCGEPNLDIDIAISLIYPQSTVNYQVDDVPQSALEANTTLKGYLNTFLDALDGSYCTYSAYGITGDSPGIDAAYPDPLPGGYKGQLQCGPYKATRVITVSYGEAEHDLPPNYQRRQCNEFLKLGLQGHSIFFSSGDYGVSSSPGDDSVTGCLSGYGQNQTIFSPTNPSTCPWLTSVGATQLNSNETIGDPESALQFPLPDVPLLASSGGFGNYFTAPDYQKSAVAEYFANHDPGYKYYVANYQGTNVGIDGGIYNRAGRGYPDVSANGANLRSFDNGTDYHWYGTSLSAPIWASVITLINEERTVAGKGPVGFINPVLYANPHVLSDITNGSNPNCGSAGFHAVPGWDPITGLGTPNYPKLLELFMSLP